MKKSLLIFFIISCFVSVVQAQNTDWEITPFQPGFLDGYDIDSGTYHVIFDSSYLYSHDGTLVSLLDYYNVHTYYDSTPTGITIYGIAISPFPLSVDYSSVVIDTSTSNWQEFTCIYKPIGDSMVLVAKAPYNQFARPDYVLPARKTYWDVRYIRPEYIIYYDTNYDVYAHRQSVIVTPVFETYFDTAVYITDSFYFGTTMECNTAVFENNHFMGNKSLYVVMSSLRNSEAYHTYMPRRRIDMNHRIMDNHRNPVDIWERFEYPYNDLFILCFPILSPEPGRTVPVDTVLNYFDTTQTDTTQVIDTTQVDTTHSGISAGMLERYINVYPALADGGAVTVLSSFHLEGVEVYDAAGRMLSRQPASGVATTVDVSQLPAGSYVLRVNTVSGSTTKKLVLR